MEITQEVYSLSGGWNSVNTTRNFNHEKCTLVLAFGSKKNIGTVGKITVLKNKYPSANIISCSTAGEIAAMNVTDDTIVSTAIEFEKTKVEPVIVNFHDFNSSEAIGLEIAKRLYTEDLKHVLIISDGQLVNGSELVSGTNSILPPDIPVTGGLAGDGADFQGTLVGLNDDIREGNVVGIGFYGDSIRIGFGTHGGWDEFGPHRTVTKSTGNVLYEVDNQNALSLYKKYLGPKADELPGSALLFPLSMKIDNSSPMLVRTILSIDESAQSMTFAGDIPEGATVRFMKSNFDRLIDGAAVAASEHFYIKERLIKPELVLLISCVGRKMILDQRIEEEIEAIQEIFGTDSVYCGFYSYGELSPTELGATCDLHNQTMTLTTYSEI